MLVSTSVVIDRPIDEVWSDLAHIESHQEWMADAESIEFETQQRHGAGTRFVCHTRVGPLRLRDVMEITEWAEGSHIRVNHQGLVAGHGEFRLEPLGPSQTRFIWEEKLEFPTKFGGPLTAWAAKPVLHAIWARNLARFQRRFT